MTFTHEMGHIIGGWCCGGTLKEFDLLPWQLPYSFFEPDPNPLVTLWSGPIIGLAAPMLGALLINKSWAWFIAYFCVLANGIYLLTAWISGEPLLDTPRLLKEGTHPITIAIYCIVTILVGYRGFRKCCISFLAYSEEILPDKRLG